MTTNLGAADPRPPGFSTDPDAAPDSERRDPPVLPARAARPRSTRSCRSGRCRRPRSSASSTSSSTSCARGPAWSRASSGSRSRPRRAPGSPRSATTRELGARPLRRTIEDLVVAPARRADGARSGLARGNCPNSVRSVIRVPRPGRSQRSPRYFVIFFTQPDATIASLATIRRARPQARPLVPAQGPAARGPRAGRDRAHGRARGAARGAPARRHLPAGRPGPVAVLRPRRPHQGQQGHARRQVADARVSRPGRAVRRQLHARRRPAHRDGRGGRERAALRDRSRPLRGADAQRTPRSASR